MLLFERARQLFGESDVIYECRQCGTTLTSGPETCRNCGADDVAEFHIE